MEENMNQTPEPQAPATPPKSSGMAIAAMILAILGLCTCITAPIGLILGIVALGRTNRDPRLQGRGMAIAGIVIGGLITFLALIAIPIGLAVGGISIPAFNRARKTAEQAQCMNNVRQLNMALLQYATDHDGRFPPASGWNGTLRPYYRNPKVLVCPSDKTGGPSYGMNDRIGGIAQKDVSSPADLVSFFDSDPGPNQSDGQELLPVPARHPDGNNVGFVDGHVKSVSDPKTLNWDPGLVPAPQPPP